MENSFSLETQRWWLNPQATYFVVLFEAVRPESISLLICPVVYEPDIVWMIWVKTSEIQLFSCPIFLFLYSQSYTQHCHPYIHQLEILIPYSLSITSQSLPYVSKNHKDTK